MLMAWVPAVTGAESLPRLLDAVEEAPSLLAEQAAFEQADASRARRYQEGGWELFGSAGAGVYREPVVEGLNRRYRGTSGSIGIQHPLLGTDEQQRRAEWQARGEAGAAWYRYQEALQTLSRDVAESYARVWHARQLQSLSQAMLRVEPDLERILAERRDERLIREDEAASLRRSLDGARLDADEARVDEHEARMELENLLGRPVRLESTSAWFDPHLATCGTPGMDPTPEVLAVEEELRAVKEREALTRFHAVRSNLQLRYSSSYEDDVSRLGSGLEVVWSVSVPLRALGGDNALQRELRAEQRQLRHQRASATQAVEQRRDLARQRLEVHSRRLDSRLREMESAAHALAVVQERAENRVSVPWEEEMPARQAYYQAARGWLDSALEVWRAQIGCDRLASDRPQPMEPIRHARATLGDDPATDASLPYAGRIYLWDSEPVIRGEDPEFWTLLRRAGVEHVWLSLDGEQIDRHSEHPGVLREFLHQARQRQVDVGLLLGEPTWALPEARDDLVRIIQRLEGIDFADLHLDIEIDQLDVLRYEREELLDQWLETVAAAVAVSPWPVGLSAHPRDFGGPDRCLACEFAEVGVTELALMTYVTHADGMVHRLEPVLAQEPGLTITLAQSVESILSPQNSWFHQGWGAMLRTLDTATEQLDHPRLPVAIQSYSYLRKMWAHEDSL
nr:TolC family protein [Thioalkalivibrio versutus]